MLQTGLFDKSNGEILYIIEIAEITFSTKTTNINNTRKCMLMISAVQGDGRALNETNMVPFI